MRKYKLAVLVSHPIQYQVPLFKILAQHPEIDLVVYFCTDWGVKEKFDSGFGKKIKWDIPLLEGYKYKFLKNWSIKPRPTFFGQINFGVITELIKNKYDAIIIHGWNAITNLLAFLGARLTKTSVLMRGENPLFYEFYKPKFRILIKKFLLRKLFRKIGAFLFIGEENKRFYQFYGVEEEKLFFTPYAVDNDRFMKEYHRLIGKKEELRKRLLGIDSDKVVILFVGKFISKKNPLDLLKAYKMLDCKNKVLVFVGEGTLRKEMEWYIRNNSLKDVFIIGFKNQTELPQYYILGDIFVLPSGIGETWGLVVNEAMCFKLPVIVSNVVGCVPDLVKDNENGYIFPVGDIKRLRDYLKDLVENPEKRRKFGGRSFGIIQDYSYENDIEGILEALENISKIERK